MSDREPIADGAGKSGALLERVVIDGERYVVKYLHRADDWTMRAAGDLTGASFTAWRRGLLARLPDCLNQPIVGVARDLGGCVLLMRDVGEWLVPVTDALTRSDSTWASLITWPRCMPPSGMPARRSK